jgi:hypothetical protein
MLLATAASLAVLFSVQTSDAQMVRYGRPYYGAYRYNPYRSYYRPYNIYRPYAYPVYPSYYYGPTYYPGTSFYYNTPSFGFYIR